MPKLLVLSRGIRKIPHGPEFVPELGAWKSSVAADFDAVAGWGHKPTADKARELARQRGVPYVALEDGFLRSVRLGRDDEPPLSLVVDPVGIYYDARQPSQLERWLEEGGWESEELLRRARFVRQWLTDEQLSKYNHLPGRDLWPPAEVERVLVVDQTFEDMSVEGGLADAETFARMLQAALDENPAAEVVVRSHPEVLAGHRPGYLGTLPQHPRLKVLPEDVHPWSVLEGVSRVYTVSSLLGFEALLAGKAVRCFGMPFYAGWGLTEDEMVCARRTRQRTVDEVFAAAYLKYARYVDPIRGRRCEVEQTISLLSDRRRQWLRSQGPVVFSGASLWRRSFLPPFISSRGQAHFVRKPEQALAKAGRLGGRWAYWAAVETEPMSRLAQAAAVPTQRVEDAFFRSVGLGSDLCRPWSLVLDDQGIYYDSSRPSRLESILRQGAFPAGLLRRAEALHRTILERRLTKYNVGRQLRQTAPVEGQSLVLVPGQVEDDASILRGSPVVRSNLELLKRVRSARPDAYVLYKPHPDVVVGNRCGAVADAEALNWCDEVVEGLSIVDLLSRVDEVHTMTSLAGFEALLRGCRVVTYGQPFYAGWGLTEDHFPASGRQRTLSIEELIAGALILYPTYIDPASGQICSVEHLLDWLSTNKSKSEHPSRVVSLIRFCKFFCSKR